MFVMIILYAITCSSQASIEREICILAKLSHKGVVRYHNGWVQDVSDEENDHLQIPSSSSTSIRYAYTGCIS